MCFLKLFDLLEIFSDGFINNFHLSLMGSQYYVFVLGLYATLVLVGFLQFKLKILKEIHPFRNGLNLFI